MLRLFLSVLALFASQLAVAQQNTSETDRLVATGKLWITVKYFHPYLAYRAIDWDKALVDALPKIRAAGNSADYAAAIQSMLDALDDPSTYVLPEVGSPAAASINIEARPEGRLVVSQSSSRVAGGDESQKVLQAIDAAREIVFDLRGGDLLSSLLEQPEIQASLTAAPVYTPGQRTWVHDAFHSAFYTKAGSEVPGNSRAATRKLTFIVGENSRLPAIAAALFSAGTAIVQSESRHYRLTGESVTLEMGQGVNAVVRLAEPVFFDGTGLPEIPTTSIRGTPQALRGKLLPPFPSSLPDRAYPEFRYPSTELRILAAYKTWGAVHYFFAYRDLMDEDWDDLLPVFLPKFITAKDAREYNLALSEMVTHLADSQATVESEELSEYFGRAPIGLRLRLIDRKPVIAEVLDEEAKKVGIRAGDIVTKLDGQNIVPRINGEARYISASTRPWLGYRVMERLLNGPEGSTAALTIAGEDGQTRDVRLKRSTSYSAALRNQRTGDVLKLLPGNIGYADLDRLTGEDVDAMFDKFRDTKAIIFDMRGFPHAAASSIASRLTSQHDVASAIVTGPLALTPDLTHDDRLTSTASYFFVQRLAASNKWKYKGKTMMLIDERTISEGERIGLSLEAANKTEFVGSASAGASGDASSFVVPGGITIHFSGQDVRQANGGKLQRLGLQPAVSVAPSIEDIRQGRDEVLDKAVESVSVMRAMTGERPAVARKEAGLLQ